jgi:hypothetical protein
MKTIERKRSIALYHNLWVKKHVSAASTQPGKPPESENRTAENADLTRHLTECEQLGEFER